MQKGISEAGTDRNHRHVKDLPAIEIAGRFLRRPIIRILVVVARQFAAEIVCAHAARPCIIHEHREILSETMIGGEQQAIIVRCISIVGLHDGAI